jgi:hypothetical protein
MDDARAGAIVKDILEGLRGVIRRHGRFDFTLAPAS